MRFSSDRGGEGIKDYDNRLEIEKQNKKKNRKISLKQMDERAKIYNRVRNELRSIRKSAKRKKKRERATVDDKSFCASFVSDCSVLWRKKKERKRKTYANLEIWKG